MRAEIAVRVAGDILGGQRREFHGPDACTGDEKGVASVLAHVHDRDRAVRRRGKKVRQAGRFEEVLAPLSWTCATSSSHSVARAIRRSTAREIPWFSGKISCMSRAAARSRSRVGLFGVFLPQVGVSPPQLQYVRPQDTPALLDHLDRRFGIAGGELAGGRVAAESG